MKTLIIYYSKYYNNTKKIADCLAEELDAELIKAEDFNDMEIESYDLIGFGSGVYNQKIHPMIFDIINKINVQNKNVFIFSTSAAGIDMFNKNVIDLLISKDAFIKGSFSCKGFYTNNFLKLFGGTAKGHPNDDDLLNAKNFAYKILSK